MVVAAARAGLAAVALLAGDISAIRAARVDPVAAPCATNRGSGPRLQPERGECPGEAEFALGSAQIKIQPAVRARGTFAFKGVVADCRLGTGTQVRGLSGWP